jgi:hypothetical protein
VSLKEKILLFLKIQAATFAIGGAFILRDISLQVLHEKKASLAAGVAPAFASPMAESLRRLSAALAHDHWFFLLPFYGVCLFAIRTDLMSRTIQHVFVKWSVMFFVMEFTTEWTKYGWDYVSADLPVQLLRYLSGGLIAAAVWWLIEKSPRLRPAPVKASVRR